MAVREFQTTTGPLLWVKATSTFFAAGQHVNIGDYIQVKQGIANWLQSLDRAKIVQPEEVEAARLSKANAGPKAGVLKPGTAS